MKKIAYLLLCLIIACTTKEKEQANLVFWSSNNAAEIDFTRAKVDAWNAAGMGKKVSFQPVPEGQSSEEVILAAVVGKTTPDIYANMWQGSVEMYAKAGKLIALDTIAGFKEFILARSGQATLDEITSEDGHIYQIPWKINPIVTLYNETLLTDFDVEGLPKTYSAYLEAGAKVQQNPTKSSGSQWIGYTEVKPIWYQRFFNFYPLYLAASKGGALVKDNKAAFNNEHAVAVFSFLQKLYQRNYFSKEQSLLSQGNPFLESTILTQWTGPWTISYLEKFKSADFEYNFFPMQVPDHHEGPIYTYADPKNMVIFNTCKAPKAAWEFVKTMIDKEGDKLFLELSGQLPRRKDIARDTFFQSYFEQNPKSKAFAKQANFVKGIDNCEVIVEVFDIISQEYEACVIYNKKTAEQAVGDAAAAVDVLLGN